MAVIDRLFGGPVIYLLAIVISLIIPNGAVVAFGIYIVALAYYVIVGNTGRLPERIEGARQHRREG